MGRPLALACFTLLRACTATIFTDFTSHLWVQETQADATGKANYDIIESGSVRLQELDAVAPFEHDGSITRIAPAGETVLEAAASQAPSVLPSLSPTSKPTKAPTPEPSMRPTPMPTLCDLHTFAPAAALNGTVTKIGAVQGASIISPMVNETVLVEGIVTAKSLSGFYLQGASDGNNDTSDAIFVFTGTCGATKGGAVGDKVLVSGTVVEFEPATSKPSLTITQLSAPSIAILETNVTLPTPVVIGRGGRVAPNRTVASLDGSYDTSLYGIDFYEALEGMLVKINGPRIVNSIFGRGRTYYVVPDNGSVSAVNTPRGGIVLRPQASIRDFNPEIVLVADDLLAEGDTLLRVDVGQVMDTIEGVLNYQGYRYTVLPASSMAVSATSPDSPPRLPAKAMPAGDIITMATMNVENLADTGDNQLKFDRTADQIVNYLNSPDILALEEFVADSGSIDDGTTTSENTIALLIATISKLGGPEYKSTTIDPLDNTSSPNKGVNIRNVFFYNPARVSFTPKKSGSANSTPISVVAEAPGKPAFNRNPGFVDPMNFAFEEARKPLAAEFVFLPTDKSVFAIICHFNSNGADDKRWGAVQPPVLKSQPTRTRQAKLVNAVVEDILAINKNAYVVALGGMSDLQGSPPLLALTKNGKSMKVLAETLPNRDRYNFIYKGNAVFVDHVVVSKSIMARNVTIEPVHINTEYWDQVSDHDPVVLSFKP